MNIFLYPINYRDETNNIIANIQPYMFSNNNIMTFFRHSVSNNPLKSCTNNNNISGKDLKNNNNFGEKDLDLKKDIFYPLDKDSLFWCLYIMKYGIDKYNSLSNRNFVTEKKIKIEYVEHSRKEKSLLKQYKFSSILDFENMLANECIIHINTFLSLCVLEKMNVIVIHNENYLEVLTNDSHIVHVVLMNPHKSKYGFKTVNHEWTKTFVKSNYTKIEKITL